MVLEAHFRSFRQIDRCCLINMSPVRQTRSALPNLNLQFCCFADLVRSTRPPKRGVVCQPLQTDQSLGREFFRPRTAFDENHCMERTFEPSEHE